MKCDQSTYIYGWWRCHDGLSGSPISLNHRLGRHILPEILKIWRSREYISRDRLAYRWALLVPPSRTSKQYWQIGRRCTLKADLRPTRGDARRRIVKEKNDEALRKDWLDEVYLLDKLQWHSQAFSQMLPRFETMSDGRFRRLNMSERHVDFFNDDHGSVSFALYQTGLKRPSFAAVVSNKIFDLLNYLRAS